MALRTVEADSVNRGLPLGRMNHLANSQHGRAARHGQQFRDAGFGLRRLPQASLKLIFDVFPDVILDVTLRCDPACKRILA